jgi:hypothetical protein
MSFTKHQLKLPGSAKTAQNYKTCSVCEKDQPPEGGIEMSPTRWVCVVCWTRQTKKKGKS